MDDLKTRNCENYCENGQLEVSCSYKEDKMNGTWIQWYENGIKKNVKHYDLVTKTGVCLNMIRQER